MFIPGDFISQSVQEDWQTVGQELLKTVSQVRHDLTHAGDGSLLHLLVNILRLESGEAALVDVVGVESEVKCCW